MSTDVMASGKQEVPEMFEFSTANFSASVFGSDVFAVPPEDANESSKDERPVPAFGLGERNDSENNTNEELGAEWVSFKGGDNQEDQDASDKEFFAGLENARLVLKTENDQKEKKDKEEEEKASAGEQDGASKIPRLRRCATDTVATRGLSEKAPDPAATRGASPKGTHRGRKPGGDEMSKNSNRERKSVSPKRSPSRTTSLASKANRAASPKRGTLRRTTSSGENPTSESATARPKKGALRRTTSGGGVGGYDLSRLKASSHKRGCGASVASAPPPGTRRLPGRSNSAKVSRGDRSERSLSPRRIVSSRKIKDSASSDPEITDILDESASELESGTPKKASPIARSISTPSDKTKRSSSPSLLNKPQMAARSKNSGKHGIRASSPSIIAKAHERARGERIKRGPSPTHGKKRGSSPGDSSLIRRSSSPHHDIEPKPSGVEPKKRASCPDVFGADSDDDSEENNEAKETTKAEKNTEGKTVNAALEVATDELTIDIDESTAVDAADGSDGGAAKNAIAAGGSVETSENDKKDAGESPAESQDAHAKEKGKTLKASSSEMDKPKKRDHHKSKERSPSRGTSRSRSMPKTPSKRELSRSPSRLGTSDKTSPTRREKSPPRDLKRAPTSMREVMARELTKSEEDAKDAPKRGLERSPASSREVSRSPPRELKRGAASSREFSRSPSRGLVRTDASTRDVSRPAMSKAHSTRIGSDDKHTRARSPTRKAPARTTSEKATRPSRRGLGPRAASSRSPMGRSPSRRMKEESLQDHSGGGLNSSDHHGRERHAASRHGGIKDDGNDQLARNTTKGRLESKRSRRLPKEDVEAESKPDQEAQEPAKSGTKQSRGPPMRRTLSGPGPRGARGRSLGNIQQRQLMGGLEAETDRQKDLPDSDDEQLHNGSSWHGEQRKNAFPDEAIGDLFANSTWHNGPNDANKPDPSFSPLGVPKISVMNAFAGTAKRAADMFGLSASTHGPSPQEEQEKSGKQQKLRTSIFRGKGNKAIQGPSMLSLGGSGGVGDDLDSSSDEFA